MQKTADRVREYARLQYVEPARRRHQSTVKIVAGEVHKALHLDGRVPAVCAALKGPKFLTENRLVLEKWDGPPSGQSTTVAFTYRLGEEQPQLAAKEDSLLRLWGIGKEVFQSLGGAETFIRRERERFYKWVDEP